MKAAAVPNPARRTMRPVNLITDRAKRYRANATPPPGPKRCNFCTSRRNVDIDHISGDEADGRPRNLIYLCRRCNAAKGNVQTRGNIGKRTRQYNPGQQLRSAQTFFLSPTLKGPTVRVPARAPLARVMERAGTRKAPRLLIESVSVNDRPAYGWIDADQLESRTLFNPAHAPTFAQFVNAALVLRGDETGNAAHATEVILATPPARRLDYANRIEKARRNPEVPTFAQYAFAVSQQTGRHYIRGQGFTEGDHGEAGAIIHATPRELRSEYARKIAASKRSKARTAYADAVPF